MALRLTHLCEITRTCNNAKYCPLVLELSN